MASLVAVDCGREASLQAQREHHRGGAHDYIEEVTNIKDELETVEDELCWLGARKNKFPRVFALLHVYRSVASTAEVKQLFSISTRLARPTRATMSARLLESRNPRDNQDGAQDRGPGARRDVKEAAARAEKAASSILLFEGFCEFAQL